MCGYAGQERKDFERKMDKNWHENYAHLLNSDWFEPIEEIEYLRGRSLEFNSVAGIGDFFCIHFEMGGIPYKDWGKFGTKLPWTNGSYFNAQIEKVETYFDDAYQKSFGIEVRSDLIERPCIVFVNRFWEKRKAKPNQYYRIERTDGSLIPLAGFYKNKVDNMTVGYPEFTLLTKDPYPAIESIGHHRSPVILDYKNLKDWLNPDIDFKQRKELISESDNKVPYQINEVEKQGVTKHLPEALESLSLVKEEIFLNQNF